LNPPENSAARIALYTFGQFSKPSADPANGGFHRRNDPILAMVDKAPGLIARSGYDSDPGPPSWGTQVFPRFWIDNGDGFAPSTLSVWRDMESAFAFSYFGLHAEALKHGREWFQKPQWPPYVLWWVKTAFRPDWSQAIIRHEYLHDNGPTPQAFTFKQAFNASGSPLKLDKSKVERAQQAS
jgi:hypothetical protein